MTTAIITLAAFVLLMTAAALAAYPIVKVGHSVFDALLGEQHDAPEWDGAPR
jgi:hypothetical protein